MNESIRQIEHVAAALGDYCEQVVFLGGATLPLLITDPAAGPVRPTDDVDVIVETTSYLQYGRLEETLRSRGWRNVPDVICRWRTFNGVVVDVMPVDQAVLGFSNRWYPTAFKTAEPFVLPNATMIRRITAPAFTATKLEAFASRGNSDYYASRDLEDIIALVDGRMELEEEMHRAPDAVRDYIGEQVRALLSNPVFLGALPGHLAHDSLSSGRARVVERRLRALCP